MTNEAPKILNAPERIYLHVGSLDDALDDVPFSELSEVSWCAHRVDDADIEYVLADDAAATIRQQAERIGVLEAALRQVTDHFADVMGGPLIAGSGVTFHSGIENIPTIKAARAALTTAAPEGGDEVMNRFFVDGACYETKHAVLTAMEIKHVAGVSSSANLAPENVRPALEAGSSIFLSDTALIDVTGEPHFYSSPQAR